MARALFVAYVLGAIVWGICWIVISRFLEKLPTLSSWLGRWRLLRWIAGVMNLNLDRPWEENFARQALCFTAAGFLILSAVYLWGAYKRSVQWYAIEPPPDISGGINGPLRPDSDAWLTDWTVKGVFWSKAACLQGIRRNAEAVRGLEDEVRSFVSAQRCISARSPHAPAPESDSDWESSDDPGDVP
jgi:hypothetical protein